MNNQSSKSNQTKHESLRVILKKNFFLLFFLLVCPHSGRSINEQEKKIVFKKTPDTSPPLKPLFKVTIL